ncbi:hypothetical protein [Argonema antarcticum]|uniref:hypothetical protein n=1 Tax=Argonema antarcticum TaxID=2942763 RepID=UPI002012A51F|nr:hypothetical protein [Argonema antarcticum]MCL1470057.1 hypothetical protein [Argonema antarcticum A004/B2]
MNLLPEEEVLYDNKNLGLILTTHRVRADGYSFGNYFLRSIMLEKIASVAVAKVSYPGLLFYGVLFFGVGLFFFVYNSNFFYISLIGLILVFAYFITIRKVLEIASCGAVIRINIPVSIDMKEVKQFIEILEDAKDARYMIGKHDILPNYSGARRW